MRDLAALQQQFQHYLLQQAADIENDVVSTAHVPATTRLAIYQDAYYSRLLEVLTQDYAALYDLLGADEFAQLGQAYIEAHPSRYRSIRWFSNHFPHFLQLTAPYNEHPWLHELALFEWELMQAFDACDEVILTIEEMATIPPEKWADMRFHLPVSLRRVNLHWNVVALWKEGKNKQLALERSDTPVSWLIWRKDLDVQFCSLSADQAYMLDAMLAHEDFGTICGGLCEWVAEEAVAMHAAQLLKQWIHDGCVASVECSNPINEDK